MMKEIKTDLNKFFYPKTIAIVGASENQEKVGGILMKKTENFKGKIIPVNPNYKEVSGKKCYSRIKDYKNSIDLAVIVTPRETVKSIVKECINKRIKYIIIISAGFAEIGNIKEQEEIVKLANSKGTRILGPNCFGIFNPDINLDLTFSNTSPRKGSTAFISQSGAIWSYFSDIENIGYSKFASLGNMSDLEFTEVLEYLINDRQTKKILLYIEKLKNGKKFIELCKKSKKEIIAIKAGSSKQGAEAAISHTGSLATDYRIYEGIFKQSKIKQIKNFFSEIKIPRGDSMIITNAGGAGALMTDACNVRNSKVVKDLDILGTAMPEDYKKALENSNNLKFENLIVVLTPQKMSRPYETAKVIVEFAKNQKLKKSKKKIIACFLGDKSIRQSEKLFKQAGIYCFTGKDIVKKLVK